MGRAGVEPTALEKNNFAVAEDKLHRNLPQNEQFFNMLRLIGKKNSLFTTCQGRVITYYSSFSFLFLALIVTRPTPPSNAIAAGPPIDMIKPVGTAPDLSFV